jgi:hypothetical protein
MRKTILGLAAAVLSAGVVATVALANHTGPISANADSVMFVAGNPTCPANTTALTKFDPVESGTQSGIQLTKNGDLVNWAILPAFLDDFDVAIVIVKGGPNANVYTYDFATTAADDSDTGLHAPVNHNNDKFYGLSHVTICIDPKGGGDN